MTVSVWHNGRLVPADSARVAADDHGLVVGDGVFETLLVRDGRPFAVTRHLERLQHSATGLGLAGLDLDEIRRGVDALAAAQSLPRGRLRITVTAGRSPLSSERGAGPLTVLIGASQIPPRRPAADVVTVPWVRNERAATAGLKTTSYADNVIALARARELGADEALLANTRGELCEGTGTNVVVERDGRLVTPPLSSGCLAGITRALALEWCDVIEDDLPYSALTDATECLLLSSTRELQPIASVDGAARTTGPLTDRAVQQWSAACAAAGEDP